MKNGKKVLLGSAGLLVAGSLLVACGVKLKQELKLR